ncbi:hypothetical protein QGN23_03000 [Chryseobacterium gotjawalense]|uniref:DUF5041 domain-containing protein n=1 Tax=Chryseobacterium gotjawalense TaxID=3042315 RepID=A0ABY8RGU9_9FLAO|nr:hypothetical protein [Chryseobacterium sp. wdc7]WHF52252.1 hypothetical protein QGN23_03000 [Chryseobacterium sp. wdc7]
MRKISILLLLMMGSFGFAQTYQFDFLTKYVSTNLQNKRSNEFVSYNNSDDFSYYLKLRKSDSDFTATLYDHERNLAHHFSVVESKVGNEIQFQFLYVNTSKLQNIIKHENYRYEFSEISADSPKIISLKIYASKRAKKPRVEKELTLKKANKNLIQLYRSDWLHWSDSTYDLSKIGNYIVAESIEKFNNNICQTNLKEYKNVDLKITIPKELKF